MLTAEGIVVQSFNADLLYEPWEVVDDEGQPFTMFAAFWNRCLSMPYDPPAPLLPPKKINSGAWRTMSLNFLASTCTDSLLTTYCF
jgi:cryptochrome 1